LTQYDAKRKRYPPKEGKTMPDLDNIELGGSRQFHLAVLSVDIRGFTKITMDYGDGQIQQLAKLQALFLSEMSELIKRNNGVTEKYTGDGVMGLFGTEFDTKANDDVNNAASCALDVKLILKNSINPFLVKKSLPQIEVGMGIDYGPVLIEKVGLRGDNQFSLAGRAVSLAAKMQGLAKANEIFVGENVYKRLTYGNFKGSCSPLTLGSAWPYQYQVYSFNTRWSE
jgi:class 3 adenylate cyclase